MWCFARRVRLLLGDSAIANRKLEFGAQILVLGMQVRSLASPRLLRHAAAQRPVFLQVVPKPFGDSYGSLRIPMDPHGSLRIPMDSYGSLRIPMDSYGSLRIPTDTYGYLQIPIDSYGSLRIPIDPYASLRIPTDSYRFLWIPTDPYGSLRIPKKFETS